MVGREIDEARRLERERPADDAVVLGVEDLTRRGRPGRHGGHERVFRDSSGRDRRHRGRRRQRAARAGRGDLRDARARAAARVRVAGKGSARAAIRAAAIARRRRARARGPPRHGARAEPERRGQRRAEDATGARRSPAARCSRSGGCASSRSQLIERYDVQDPGPGDTRCATSRAAISRSSSWGASSQGEPRVLVAAQPTRGLDVGAIETVHAYLREAAAEGVAVLLISEDLDEIRALADRILVMYEGAIVGELDAGGGDVEELGYLMAGGRRVRIERRLDQPRWLLVAVPVGSLVVAFALMAVVLARDRSQPGLDLPEDLRLRLHRATARFTSTLVFATPLALHRARRGSGLPDAALQHRRRGPALPGRRRRRMGSRSSSAIGARRRRRSTCSRCASPAAVAGGLWAAIPGVLRAFAKTNEIITSLMLNYVAGLLLTYLIIDSAVLLARHVDASRRQTFPHGKTLPEAVRLADRSARAATWSSRSGSASRSGCAVLMWFSTDARGSASRLQVIGDSPRAARYAGMRTRRKILVVMCLSGAVAGLGGASQEGDFAHKLDHPTGLQAARLRLHRNRRRGARPLQPVRRRARSRCSSAGSRTPATPCRDPTSPPGSWA